MSAKSDEVDFGTFVELYERMGEPVTRPFAVQALDLAALETGARVIDVAAGTGSLALAAAERGLSVLATDFAPPMVARAADRLQPFAKCEARVMSMDALDVPDSSFDAAFSIMGTLLLAGWQQGLRELTRVTKPDGFVVAAVWTEGRDASPGLWSKRVFEHCFPEREAWPRDFFPSWSEAKLEEALRAVGCQVIEVRVATSAWHPVSPSGQPLTPAEAVAASEPMFLNFPGFAALDLDDRKRLRAALEADLERRVIAGKGIYMPIEAFIAAGRKVRVPS